MYKLSLTPYLMTADEFGKYYTGSAKAKQNHRKAKMMAKRSH